MTKNLLKLGRSYGLVLPADFVRQTGKTVLLRRSGRNLIIVPTRRSKLSLRQILKKVTPGVLGSELDWGKPMGQEAW